MSNTPVEKTILPPLTSISTNEKKNYEMHDDLNYHYIICSVCYNLLGDLTVPPPSFVKSITKNSL